MSKENSETKQEKCITPENRFKDAEQVKSEKQPRFIGTVVQLNDRMEEVVQYPKGQYTINYAPYFFEATEVRLGIISRIPYTSINFIKEITR